MARNRIGLQVEGFEELMAKLDEVGGIGRGKLDERGQADLALGEGGARLGIEADDRLRCEVKTRLLDLLFAVDDADLATKLDGRQLCRLLVINLMDKWLLCHDVNIDHKGTINSAIATLSRSNFQRALLRLDNLAPIQ